MYLCVLFYIPSLVNKGQCSHLKPLQKFRYCWYIVLTSHKFNRYPLSIFVLAENLCSSCIFIIYQNPENLQTFSIMILVWLPSGSVVYVERCSLISLIINTEQVSLTQYTSENNRTHVKLKTLVTTLKKHWRKVFWK